MVILGNFKGSYDTATTTANKSMGSDLSATQSCSSFLKLNYGNTLNLATLYHPSPGL